MIFGLSVLVTDALAMRSLIDASGDIGTTTIAFLLRSALTFMPLVFATAKFLAAVAAGSRKGFWRMSHPALQKALRNHVCDSLGLPRIYIAR